MRNKALYIVGFLLLVILCGVGGFVYYLKAQQAQKNSYIQAVTTAKTAFDQGSFSESLTLLQTALSGAPDKKQEGRLRLIIAASYLDRNQGDDLVTSIKLYKGIANDETLPPVWRAFALNDIAAVIHFRSPSFYTLNFPEVPFAGLMPDTGPDATRTNTAFANLLQLSDKIYPTSNAEYSLAEHYMELVSQTNFASSSDNVKSAKLAQQYITEGDTRNDQNLYPPFTLLYILLNRAVAYSGSAIILQNETAEQRAAAYQLVLDTATKYNQDLTGSSASALYLTRFYYAAFLLSDTSQTTKIQDLLKPYSQLNSPASPTPAIFNNLMSQSSNSFLESKFIPLAKISPEFKAFLSRMGLPTK